MVIVERGYGWFAGAFGGLVLFLYGIVPTFQPSNFGRVYAAYGGIFVVMAIIWGFFFEKVIPDIYDIARTIITSIGVIIIFYYPRKDESKVGITSPHPNDCFRINFYHILAICSSSYRRNRWRLSCMVMVERKKKNNIWIVGRFYPISIRYCSNVSAF